MNVENIKKVRDHIASLPSKRYDQTNWTWGCAEPEDLLHTCGTAGCIAGWAIAICNPGPPWPGESSYSDRAARVLGINQYQASRLFSAAPLDADPTQAEAVTVLDGLIATGMVEWAAIDTPQNVAREGERSEVRTTPNPTDGGQ